MHRFRLVHKNQLNNLNFESYWLVHLKFRAPDWSKFKLFGRIYDWFSCNRNLCSTLVQTTLISPDFLSVMSSIIKKNDVFWLFACMHYIQRVKLLSLSCPGSLHAITSHLFLSFLALKERNWAYAAAKNHNVL